MTYKTPYILTEAGRYADLMKQGFMKPLKVTRPAKIIPMVSCYGCMNWHRQGQHSNIDATARRANFKAYRANQIRVGWDAPKKMERV